MLACALRSVQRAACLHAPAGAPMRVAHLARQHVWGRVLDRAQGLARGLVLEVVRDHVLAGAERGAQRIVWEHV